VKKARCLFQLGRFCSAMFGSMLLAIALVPTVAQANSACDDLLENMPPRGPDRLAAGRPCIDELPNLPRADQTRIVRHYARNLPDYIDPAEIDSVVDDLPEDIALPLASYAARYSAIGPGDELTRSARRRSRDGAPSISDGCARFP